MASNLLAKAAEAEAKKAAANLGIPMGDEDNNDDDEDDEEAKKRYRMRSMATIGLAVGAAGTAVGSSLLTAPTLIDVASVATAGMAPLVVYQTVKLEQMGGMRGQQNKLREKVNAITVENDKLTGSVDDLENQVSSLKHVESDLENIAEKAGGQVDRLVEVIKENGELQEKIKLQLQQDVLQQIVTSIVTVDRDQDFKLSKREVRQLEYRLKNIPGIIFNLERFRKFLESDQGDLTVKDVVTLAHNLENPDIPDDQRVFRFAPKDILAKKKAQK